MAELFIPRNVRQFKSIRHFKTPSGSHVIVLPTCTVPLVHLVPENWHKFDRMHSIGHVRRVFMIERLTNAQRVKDNRGRSTALFVKSPELELVPNQPEHPFPRGFEYGVRLDSKDVRVQKQAIWEARILLGLKKKGIRAEVPQAIVIDKEGNRSVVTRGINRTRRPISFSSGERVRIAVERAGFGQWDLFNNLIRDKSGRLHVIDVNRWEWPLFIYVYKKRLLEAIAERAKTTKPRPSVRL